MEIKVLGPGCAKCKMTEELVREVLAESGISAEVIKVTDTMEIARHGVFMTPAVIVDSEVKCVGKVPAKKEISEWLKR